MAGDLVDRVRAAGLDAGLDDVGITDVEPFADVRASIEARQAAGHHAGMSFTFRDPRRSTEPRRLLRNAQSLVVGIRSYLEPGPPRPDQPSASVSRYAWRDHYADLRAGLGAMAEVLRAAGHRASVVCDQNGLVDRAAAHRAGLAWWGRNSNLLRPGIGSWFVIGSVVTDAPLRSGARPMADGCRTCTRCVTACPTDAIVADGVIDARRCLAWLVQQDGVLPRAHRIALGDRLYGCDDCQDACPPGRNAVQAVTDTPVSIGSLDAWVPVLELLDATDAELLDRFGRWYVPNREPRYLRRNALVVLGNVGRADHTATRSALERWARDGDELLRAHAVWSAARLALVELVEAAHADPHPWVRAEAAMAASVPLAPGARSTAEAAPR